MWSLESGKGLRSMLMVRRKVGRWVHCIHEKTGEPISIQIRQVTQVGEAYQVTIAIQDEQRNYRVLKPGDREERRLEKPPDRE
jgi:hypothetical protein